MAITVDVKPETLEALRRQAEAAGITVEELARRILVREIGLGEDYHPKLKSYLDKVECLRGKLGPVPERALDPELMYGGR